MGCLTAACPLNYGNTQKKSLVVFDAVRAGQQPHQTDRLPHHVKSRSRRLRHWFVLLVALISVSTNGSLVPPFVAYIAAYHVVSAADKHLPPVIATFVIAVEPPAPALAATFLDPLDAKALRVMPPTPPDASTTCPTTLHVLTRRHPLRPAPRTTSPHYFAGCLAATLPSLPRSTTQQKRSTSHRRETPA